MSKETRAFLAGLLLPLVLAVSGWITAHARKMEAEAAREAKYELADGYQAFIEEMMKREACEP